MPAPELTLSEICRHISDSPLGVSHTMDMLDVAIVALLGLGIIWEAHRMWEG